VLPLETPGHQNLKFLNIKGLNDVIQSPGLKGFHRLLNAAVSRDDDNRCLRLILFDVFKNLHAA